MSVLPRGKLLVPLLMLALLLSACGAGVTAEEDQNKHTEEIMTTNTVTESWTVGEVKAIPAFEDFGRLLFPVDRQVPDSMTLKELSSANVYVWYSYIRSDKTVEIINDLKARAENGERVFFPIYTNAERRDDPTLNDTGLFFFRGEPGEKFAVMNAGGGFLYVGAMHDSFPHALEASRNGYNAFALIYRPNYAYEDLARAITFIHVHADELQIDPENYSLWGGSAGARMAAVLGNADYLRELTGRADIPQAAAVVMQYTGYTYVSRSDAPTYVCVGKNDGIASWRTMQRRLETLESYGIPTEFHAYEGLPHGFGLGTGTVAEGWIEDAFAFWEAQCSDKDMKTLSMDELRPGSSVDTVYTPDDFPEEYFYGSGTVSGWTREYMLKRLPEPEGNETVFNTTPDPMKFQALYLWEEGNAPAVTKVTERMTGYFDPWDFRPYVTAIPMRSGVTPKGAVLLMAGGAYQFRGNYTDALTTAAALREYGFQTFVVDYRLHPYNQEEGALDVARAVRFVRKNAAVYGIDPDDIAVMGFSAGAIQAGEFLMHYDEGVLPTALDRSYVPDELDEIPAHAAADGMIYGFYGRLSVGNMDPTWLREGELPPTFYVYGTEDPFYRQFERQYSVLKDMGIPVSRIVLDGWPHGFGSDGGWVKDYADWLESVFLSDKK